MNGSEDIMDWLRRQKAQTSPRRSAEFLPVGKALVWRISVKCQLINAIFEIDD